jgi:hypothetical protein
MFTLYLEANFKYLKWRRIVLYYLIFVNEEQRENNWKFELLTPVLLAAGHYGFHALRQDIRQLAFYGPKL